MHIERRIGVTGLVLLGAALVLTGLALLRYSSDGARRDVLKWRISPKVTS